MARRGIEDLTMQNSNVAQMKLSAMLGIHSYKKPIVYLSVAQLPLSAYGDDAFKPSVEQMKRGLLNE